MNVLKRKIAFLIAAAFAAANISYVPMSANAENEQTFWLYDIDGDNKITVGDLAEIHQIILNYKSSDYEFDVFDEIILKNLIINPEKINDVTTIETETTYEITEETSFTYTEDTSVSEAVTTVEETTVSEMIPTSEETTVSETVATVEETTVSETIPTSEETTLLETIPTSEETTVSETVTTVEETTVSETVTTVEETTLSEAITTSEETTVSEAIPTSEETTLSETIPTSKETTTAEETSVIIVNTDLETEDNGYIYALAQHQMYAPTPSIGDVKSCVIMIEFADTEFSDDCYSPEEIHDMLFGAGNSRLYPYNSVTDYYNRASYGRFNITGDIYKTKIDLSFDKDADNTFVLNTIKKALSSLDNEVDFSQYDSDNDGIIDHVVFIPAISEASASEWGGAWWSRTISITGSMAYDNTNFKTMIIDHYQPLTDNIQQEFLFMNSIIHETGHSLGLQDYYSYDGSEQDVFKGTAGFEIMESSTGDFGAFSKLMLGWYEPNEVQIFKDDISTYYLGNSAETPSCLILPIGTISSKLASEYFVVEYLTNTNNNTKAANQSGIRIWHADAETKKVSGIVNLWIYNNMYSTSSRDLLALVNNGNGFFNTGDIISGETVDDFLAYDADGNIAVDTGYVIEVGSLKDGKYKLTVTEN